MIRMTGSRLELSKQHSTTSYGRIKAGGVGASTMKVELNLRMSILIGAKINPPSRRPKNTQPRIKEAGIVWTAYYGKPGAVVISAAEQVCWGRKHGEVYSGAEE